MITFTFSSWYSLIYCSTKTVAREVWAPQPWVPWFSQGSELLATGKRVYIYFPFFFFFLFHVIEIFTCLVHFLTTKLCFLLYCLTYIGVSNGWVPNLCHFVNWIIYKYLSVIHYLIYVYMNLIYSFGNFNTCSEGFS